MVLRTGLIQWPVLALETIVMAVFQAALQALSRSMDLLKQETVFMAHAVSRNHVEAHDPCSC